MCKLSSHSVGFCWSSCHIVQVKISWEIHGWLINLSVNLENVVKLIMFISIVDQFAACLHWQLLNSRFLA